MWENARPDGTAGLRSPLKSGTLRDAVKTSLTLLRYSTRLRASIGGWVRKGHFCGRV